jgi:hypothetical protein
MVSCDADGPTDSPLRNPFLEHRRRQIFGSWQAAMYCFSFAQYMFPYSVLGARSMLAWQGMEVGQLSRLTHYLRGHDAVIDRRYPMPGTLPADQNRCSFSSFAACAVTTR